MAATIYKSSAVTNTVFGTPSVSGILVTSFNVSESAPAIELKDGDGVVQAVAIPETVTDISIEGNLNGTLSIDVGDVLSVTSTELPTGGTIIVNKFDKKFSQGNFQTVSIGARRYSQTMTVEE